MRDRIKIALLCLCILPALLLCGCSDLDEIHRLNFDRYFSSVVAEYADGTRRELDLGTLSESQGKSANASKFTQLSIEGDGPWLFKMYIERIEFDIYTSESASGGSGAMTLTFKMTGLTDETTFTEDRTYRPEDFVKILNCSPIKNGVVHLSVEIKKVVATATGANITLDISESAENTILDPNKDFRWTVFNFSVYGQSRTYNH